MKRRRRTSDVVCATLALAAGLALGACRHEPATDGTDLFGARERIAYFEGRLAADPDHWPSLAHLGAAWLDLARESHDPDHVAAAREALARSIELQPNLEALKARSALAGFCHRFEEALAWADRAAESAEDPLEVVALRVEALLGLGRKAEASDLVRSAGPRTDSFPLLAARSQLLAADGRADQAVTALELAAELATRADAPELEVWCLVRSAGILIDADRPEDAEAFLARAEALAPEDVFLLTHRAKLLETTGDLERALASTEDLLRRTGNPTFHVRAAAICRSLGRPEEELRHLRSAEEGLVAVLDAGEHYSLEALTELTSIRTASRSGAGGRLDAGSR